MTIKTALFLRITKKDIIKKSKFRAMPLLKRVCLISNISRSKKIIGLRKRFFKFFVYFIKWTSKDYIFKLANKYRIYNIFYVLLL